MEIKLELGIIAGGREKGNKTRTRNHRWREGEGK